MKKLAVVLVVAAMLAGCATKTQEKISRQDEHSYDKNTNFAIKEESDGFMLTVDYSSDKFFLWGIGQETTVTKECKAQLASIAKQLADKTGRKIKPVNEEQITTTMGQGYDSKAKPRPYCHAQYKVMWE